MSLRKSRKPAGQGNVDGVGHPCLDAGRNGDRHPHPAVGDTSIVAAQPTSPTTESSAWPWWLLVAALIAVAVAVPLLLAARRRRSSWNTQLTAATGEIVWFAGQLIPQLQQDGSRDQVAGAWQVTRDRVTTLEDTLTGLQSTAPNEQEAARARDLRDAVRDARTRIDAAAETGSP